ncbi:UDP-N-acetylmuramoyl-tripeptide--D-alanyl-D-alanine ligase [Falsigemmobacter faecalis]|uniref:UDP-N-acetylmuramoyl-tripeptide--D-alanyl-D-alanine ligase n=1 Tax=Falsigemmobacter faecalis TaxID=2488730 RepID=A0A3P3DRQ3_9RHOB|nr:UDP-N-acetylmuramoyl-tripeptide--D-alanyl-D-alanine ligase [Falsigemmobacter faecalis]RRH76875.1 UDP-N-acetylmuramoyl-tripeptide--D-alanyl-D-alanine ligase [Falsigemmobacter faecalis]
MTALWTSAEAAAATHGTATRDFAITGISIDTRTLLPGDLFVALKDMRDGHDFVAQALEKGAAAALVSHRPEGLPEDAPLLIVADVLRGLEDLGRAGRARSSAKVAAITGSVGKTSTKEMLRVMLAAQGKVHVAEASYNNHWGVPLTLARMPRDTDLAVLEIGMNHPGEIAPLARLARPHVVMITTVAPAHLAAFGGIDGIAEEKAAICEGLEPAGIAVLPLGLDVTPILLRAAERAGAEIVTFGEGEATWALTSAIVTPDVTVGTARTPLGPLDFKVASPGRHFAVNALGALATAAALGADEAVAAADLVTWAPPAGRGMREKIALDPLDETLYFELIDDAFNANPVSVAAGLGLLLAAGPRHGIGRIEKGRRIAVLGDMLELGPDELALHADLAALPGMERVDLVHCVGPRSRVLYEALPIRQRGEWVATAPELVARAAQLVDAGDVLLVKGSKGIKVSLVVAALRNLRKTPAERQTEG